MIKKVIANPLVSLFVLYFLAFGFMLINAGVWWDDWGLYNMSAEGIKEEFIGNGGFYMTPIHIFLQNISNNPPLLYHFLAFFLYFFTSIFLYYTLPYLKIEGNTQFILTALFTVLPINFARIYMICFPYTLGIFFCFAGIYLFTVAFYNKQLLFRLLALICCSMAFIFLPSTFVFIPMYIAFLIGLNSIEQKRSVGENIRSFIKKTISYSDFIIITILTWGGLLIFAQPTGLYAEGNYNSFSWQTVFQSPVLMVLSFVETFFRLSWITNLINSTFLIIVFLLVFVLVLVIFRKKSFSPLQNPVFTLSYREKSIKLSVFLLLGMYFFFAGALAYIAVGKSPISIKLPDLRFQTLLGIGVSLSVLGLLIACCREKYLKYIFIFFLSVFITNNIEKGLVFQQLHYKNLALMKEMSKQEAILNNRNFLVIDNTSLQDDNATFYAFSGMAKKIFGNETRLIISEGEYNNLLTKCDINVFKKPMYNMSEIQFDGSFDYYMIVKEGDVKLRRTGPFVKLMIFDFFNKDKFAQEIDKTLKIICLPYKDEF